MKPKINLFHSRFQFVFHAFGKPLHGFRQLFYGSERKIDSHMIFRRIFSEENITRYKRNFVFNGIIKQLVCVDVFRQSYPKKKSAFRFRPFHARFGRKIFFHRLQKDIQFFAIIIPTFKNVLFQTISVRKAVHIS